MESIENYQARRHVNPQEWVNKLNQANLERAMEPIAYKLLSILQHFAPTGRDQQIAAEMVQQANRDGADITAVRLMLASAITDGLKYGNWPWNTPNHT